MYNNGIQINYAYDKDNNITALTNKKADGTNITSFNYTYDNNGNRTTETENGQTTSYTYDNLNRLAEVEYPTSQIETFTYDNAGNRLTKILGEETTTYTYDANNRLIESITNQIATNYTYDNNGNQLTENENGLIITNTYDGFNKLIETANPDGTWQENIYDALGLRVGTIENGLSYEFTYDRGNIINETNAKGETISRCIRGYNLIAQDNVEDGLSYYLNNAHGDIVNLVDIEGNIQNYYNYDAFGNLQESIVTVQNRFLYSGEQLDEITGDYYLRARYYNPEIGRFTQEDTYRGDGLNLYAYVANNPVNYIDPSGHCKCDEDDGEASPSKRISNEVEKPSGNKIAKTLLKGTYDFLIGDSINTLRDGKFNYKDVLAIADIGSNFLGAGIVAKIGAKAIGKVGVKVVSKYGDEIVGLGKKAISSIKGLFKKKETPKMDLQFFSSKSSKETGKGDWIHNKGYKPKEGERTLEGFMNNNVSIDKEIPLHTNSPGFNNNPRGTGGQFKRFGTDSHGGVKPHVHQPTRNSAPNGNIYGGTGSKTSNGGVTSPTTKDIKQLYDYLFNDKYRP